MRPTSRQIVFALLCALLTLVSPVPNAAAQTDAADCMSAMAADSPAECNCDTEAAAACAQQCGAVSAPAALPFSNHVAESAIAHAVLAAAPPPDFQSIAGPPGLQPPR